MIKTINKIDRPEASLEEILENEIILLDCSMKDSAEDDFYWQLGDIKNASKIDIELITKERIRIELFQDRYLNHPQIKVSEKLADEFGRFAPIVADKIKYLFDIKSCKNKCKKVERYDYSAQKEALQYLQNNLFNMSKRINRKRIADSGAGIFNNNHRYFLDMIKIINSSAKITKDNTIKFGKHRSEKWIKSDTDEDTVALSYCIALAGSSCGILTADTHYIQLMGVCTKLIGSEDFFEYNQDFRKIIKSNGPKIYYHDRNADRLTLAVDSKNIAFTPEFKIYSKNHEENVEIKHKIKDIWKKLHDIYKGN
jgi:hypothetical protein